jgi:hypothetical protein
VKAILPSTCNLGFEPQHCIKKKKKKKKENKEEVPNFRRNWMDKLLYSYTLEYLVIIKMDWTNVWVNMKNFDHILLSKMIVQKY